MSLDFAVTGRADSLVPTQPQPVGMLQAGLHRLVGKNEASAHFDEISRKLTAGPLTLEYLVAYSIEAYSKRS